MQNFRLWSVIHLPFIALLDILDGQRGRLFLWLPVCLGLGIGLFFMARFEPTLEILWGVGIATMLGWALIPFIAPLVAPLIIGALMISSGFALAGARTHLVDAPVLTFRYYGSVEGYIRAIDRSSSGAVRLTLTQVRMANMSPQRTPTKARVSLHSPKIEGLPEFTPRPGLHVMLTAHLSPPSGPSEPGGFDFQRMAWFDQLGAVGYTRTPVLLAGPEQKGFMLTVYKLRQNLAHGLMAHIPGQAGAFAAAILTGDRSAIAPETDEALRSTNLSHLLAISGLHMGLLTTAIFAAVRLVLAAIPFTLIYCPSKKIAAVCALCVGGFYLMLSGWNVATERAYIMISLMFVAVLIDRTAVSVRTVALAALFILILRPEVLVEPGFQMSFAATTALVAVFGWIKHSHIMLSWPRWISASATVVMSSAIAGLATAPVAAAHFNRIADFGLIANIVAVPAMGAVVMPSAVAAAVLAPFGLEGLALQVMEWAIRWILFVAHTVGGWDGAVTRIVTPSRYVLLLIALGGLFVFLWRSKWRAIGVIPVMAGFVLWTQAERPALLISADGGLAGRMTEQGRAMSKASGSGFSATTWLENDGDLPVQALAAERTMPTLDVGGVSIAHIVGRGWKTRVFEACEEADLVVVNQVWEAEYPPNCLLYDVSILRQTGALAIWNAHPEAGAILTTSRGKAGLRLWNTRELRRSAPMRVKEYELQLGDMLGRSLKGRGAWAQKSF